MGNIADFLQILGFNGLCNTFILIVYLEFRLVRYCFDHCKNFKPKGRE